MKSQKHHLILELCCRPLAAAGACRESKAAAQRGATMRLCKGSPGPEANCFPESVAFFSSWNFAASWLADHLSLGQGKRLTLIPLLLWGPCSKALILQCGYRGGGDTLPLGLFPVQYIARNGPINPFWGSSSQMLVSHFPLSPQGHHWC